jgi:mannose-6-phosphate isomerase-like protein (cupin superfamily)
MNVARTSRLGVAAVILAGAIMSACATSSAQVGPEAPITRTVGAGLQWGPCPPIFPAGCQIAVLHGDPARPNADVFLRVPGGYEIPAHSHTSPERMVLVEGQLNVRYKGAAAELLTPGEYAYGPAKLAHQATCLGDKPCTLFIAFEGPVDAEAFAASLE